MTEGTPTVYPDISDILARKGEGRKRLAALTFGEKIARMEALQERMAPFKALREARVAAADLRRSEEVQGPASRAATKS